jgi:hypothetical protein
MLQMGTNIMANQVKTPIQNYFEKVLYENLTFEIPPLWFFKSSGGITKIVASPCATIYKTLQRKLKIEYILTCIR